MSKRKRKSLGQAMGQAIVGFDYQVFRATPPPPELVEQGKPNAPVPAAGGGTLSIDLPLDGDDRTERGDPAERGDRGSRDAAEIVEQAAPEATPGEERDTD